MGSRYQNGSQRTSSSMVVCSHCGKCLPDEYSLNLHRLANHSKDFYECPQCDRTFTVKADLYKHAIEAHGDTKPKCHSCNKFYINEAGYQKHMKQYHGSFPCSYPKCHFKLDTLQNLNKHLEKHQNSPEFTCTICGCEHRSASVLKRHMEDVHVDHSCKCTVQGCRAEFNHPRNLRAHVVSLHAEQAHTKTTCKLCGHCFKGKKSSLDRHMNTVHWLEQFKSKYGKTRQDGDEENLEEIAPPQKLFTRTAPPLYGRR